MSYSHFSIYIHLTSQWPLQAACWKYSNLHQDYGIQREGNVSEVRYNTTYGSSGLVLSINWDKWKAETVSSFESVLESQEIKGLLTSLRDALAVWYNITHTEKCFNLTPAVNVDDEKQSQIHDLPINPTLMKRVLAKDERHNNATAMCQQMIKETGSWYSLCCNEDMNLIVTDAHGLGNDVFWPPSYPRRNISSYADVVSFYLEQGNKTNFFRACPDPYKIFGYSQTPIDPWSTQLDAYYGGRRIESHSNIIVGTIDITSLMSPFLFLTTFLLPRVCTQIIQQFSNGMLDPWVAGGVNVPYTTAPSFTGPIVQPIGKPNQNMISLIIEYGGHHVDLMYSSVSDPDCVKKARAIEKSYISKWIQSFS